MPAHNAYPEEVKAPLIARARELMSGPEKYSAHRAAEEVTPDSGRPSTATILNWLQPKQSTNGARRTAATSEREARQLLENLMNQGMSIQEAAKEISKLPGAPTKSELRALALEMSGSSSKLPAKRDMVAVHDSGEVEMAEEVSAEMGSLVVENRELRAELIGARADLGSALAALDAAHALIEQFCPDLATYVAFRQHRAGIVLS